MSRRRALETVGDLRMALEGIEDSMPILGCMQPERKEERNSKTSKFGKFMSPVAVWEEGVIFYQEIYEGGHEEA